MLRAWRHGGNRRLTAGIEQTELRRGLEREAIVALLHERGYAVEHAAAFAAAHGARLRGELRALHAKGGAADRAAGDEAHRRTPDSNTQSSSRAVTPRSNLVT